MFIMAPFQPDSISYHETDNTMTIPATVLTFPHFFESAPFWINALTLGLSIGRQLFGVLEDKGRFDNLGRKLAGRAWTKKSTAGYEVR